MKKVKILSLALAIILSFAVLAGCAQTTDESSSAPQSSESQSQTESSEPSESSEPEKGDPVKLVWYRYGFNSSGDYSTALDHVSKALDEYLLEKINATVEMKCFSSKEYGTKLSLAMASKEQIDVLWTSSAYNMMTPNELVRDGAIMDLTDLIESNETLYGYMSQTIWDTSRFDGRLYVVPNFKDMGIGRGLMFNKALVDKAGFDVSTVDTLADLEPYFAAIKDECTYPAAFLRLSTGPEAWYHMFYAKNAISLSKYIYYDPDTQTVYNCVDTPEFEETLKLIREFNQKGYVPSWAATDEGSAKVNELQKSGDVGVLNAGVYPAYENFWISNYGWEGKYLQMSDILLDRASTMGSSYAIPVYAENPQVSMDFITLLETDRVVGDLARFGVEGENYTRNDDDTVTVIPDSGYSFPSFAVTTLLNMSLMQGQSATTYQDTIDFVDEAIPSPLMAFAFDPTNVKAEVAAIDETASSYNLFNTGDLDPATELPKMRETLKSIGIDKVVEEAQKQIDAYLGK